MCLADKNSFMNVNVYFALANTYLYNAELIPEDI